MRGLWRDTHVRGDHRARRRRLRGRTAHDDHCSRRRAATVSASGALLASPSTRPAGSGLLPQLVVCPAVRRLRHRRRHSAGGLPNSRSVMGDFGLTAAAFAAAVSCLLLRPRRCPAATARPGCSSRSPPPMVAARQRRLGLVRGGAARAGAAAPRSPTSSSCCSRRPPSSGCWCSPSGRSPGPAGSASALDAWLIGGSLLTLSWSLALAQHGGLATAAAPRASRCRWPTRCWTSCWSAWCSPCTSGARPPTAPPSTPRSPHSP